MLNFMGRHYFFHQMFLSIKNHSLTNLNMLISAAKYQGTQETSLPPKTKNCPPKMHTMSTNIQHFCENGMEALSKSPPSKGAKEYQRQHCLCLEWSGYMDCIVQYNWAIEWHDQAWCCWWWCWGGWCECATQHLEACYEILWEPWQCRVILYLPPYTWVVHHWVSWTKKQLVCRLVRSMLPFDIWKHQCRCEKVYCGWGKQAGSLVPWGLSYAWTRGPFPPSNGR